MKKIIPLLLLILVLTGCGAEKEITNVADYEGCVLELTDAEKFVNDEGVSLVRVHAVYTNNNADPLYAMCSFAVRGFQNDTELNDYSDINGSEESLTREIKNGKSLEVSFVFELQDDSQVEILVGTPTADMETVGKAIYLNTEE